MEQEFAVIRERRVCATMPHHFELAATDEAYRAQRRQIETFTRTVRPRPRTRAITIPVVVHVIYRDADQNISEQQVLSQIEVLNEDFRFRNDDRESIPEAFQKVAGDALIEFALATRRWPAPMSRSPAPAATKPARAPAGRNQPSPAPTAPESR